MILPVNIATMAYGFDDDTVATDGIYDPIITNSEFIEISKFPMKAFGNNIRKILLEPGYFLKYSPNNNRIDLLNITQSLITPFNRSHTS